MESEIEPVTYVSRNQARQQLGRLDLMSYEEVNPHYESCVVDLLVVYACNAEKMLCEVKRVREMPSNRLRHCLSICQTERYLPCP